MLVKSVIIISSYIKLEGEIINFQMNDKRM